MLCSVMQCNVHATALVIGTLTVTVTVAGTVVVTVVLHDVVLCSVARCNVA